MSSLRYSLQRLRAQKELAKKARFYAKKIVKLCFVRAVYLTGSVAANKAGEKSDIDLLIVAKPGRLYSARAFVVVFVKAAGQYRTERKRKGKLCLNWFISSNFNFFNFKSRDGVTLFPKIIKTKSLGVFELLAQKTEEGFWEKFLGGKFGDVLESWARSYQTARFKKDPRTFRKGSEVRWSEKEIGLHPHTKDEQ